MKLSDAILKHRLSFNAPLSFTPEKRQHGWHSHLVLPPEAPRAAGRGGIPTLIPLCCSKCGRLIAKPDSSLCLLPPSPGFLHCSTLQRNLREYCMSQPGDSLEFKTIAFFVSLLSHFTVGASCQPGNKCRMCVFLVHSQPRRPLSQCYDTSFSICESVCVCLCMCICVCAWRLVKHSSHRPPASL